MNAITVTGGVGASHLPGSVAAPVLGRQSSSASRPGGLLRCWKRSSLLNRSGQQMRPQLAILARRRDLACRTAYPAANPAAKIRAKVNILNIPEAYRDAGALAIPQNG